MPSHTSKRLSKAIESPQATGNASKRLGTKTAGPWEKWRKMSRTALYIKFIETYFTIGRGSEAGKKMKLWPFQKEILEEWLADGITSGMLCIPRGGAKSTLEAAVGTAAVFLPSDQGAPRVPMIATTVSQIIETVYSQISYAVSVEPELAQRSIPFTGIGTSRIEVPRGNGKIWPMSCDLAGILGLDIYPIGFADEIAFLPQASWAALKGGLKRKGARVIGVGTPGLDRINPQYTTREKLRAGAAMPRFTWREYGGEPGADIHDEANWFIAMPGLAFGSPDIDIIRSDADELPESLFRIFHLAEHGVDGTGGWLGEDGRKVWRALTDPYDFEPKQAVWLGLDVGIKRDTSALAIAGLRPDGRIHVKTQVWVPSETEAVDTADIKQAIRDACATYQVGAISYDRRLFDSEAQALYDEGYPMMDFPQSLQRMSPACGDMLKLISERKVTHDDDATFEAHVLNGIIRPNEFGFTLSKGRARGHIDALIAAILAVERLQHKPKPRSKVWVL